MVAFLLCPPSHDGEWSALLIRTPLLSLGSILMISSKPNYLSKAPPSNTNTLGIRASTYEFWEDISIQSTAGADCGTQDSGGGCTGGSAIREGTLAGEGSRSKAQRDRAYWGMGRALDGYSLECVGKDSDCIKKMLEKVGWVQITKGLKEIREDSA